MYYLIHQQSSNSREIPNLNFLHQIADECFRGEYITIITDNSLQYFQTIHNIIYLPCNNEFREFSGWQSGIFYLENNVGIQNISGLLFSNETLLKHRPFDSAKKRAMIKSIKYSMSLPNPIMAGDIDLIRCQGPYHYPAIDSFYVSTYFCFMNKAATKYLDIYRPDFELFKILNPTPNDKSVMIKEKRSRAPNHYQFIEEWLYKKHTGPKWYAHERLSKENYQKMSIKFLSIIIEHGISQKFTTLGGRIIDFKQFIQRSALEKLVFFLKRIRYSLGWRIYRILG
jgi:hypothetical protein